MYKNQLQELAQRSCFNLPSYACIREGPDHAPRFKASVNFNGEIFESPSYCTTLRQAEHSAAEVALNVLSSRGPSRFLTARVLDETGIYKNLLQETAHRAGLDLPVYTTVRSGPGHVPVFTSTVELAGMSFNGESAKTKKQAEKNAAIAAWSALKKMPNLDSLTNKEVAEEQDQAVVAKVLSSFKPKVESRQVKRRDNVQAKRRLIRSSATSSSSSSSSSISTYSSSSPLPYQKRSLLDLLMNSSLDLSTQKRHSFVSLLPPPPPPTTSKILPPPNSSTYPLANRLAPLLQAQVKSSQVQKTFHENSASVLEEHQRDEEEWLSLSSPSSSSTSSMYRSCSWSEKITTQNELRKTQIGNRVFGPANHDSPTGLTALKVASAIHVEKMKKMYTGGGFINIAPAVQIRSVIPVCAAPPQSTRPNPPLKQSSTATITVPPPPPPPPPPSTEAGDHDQDQVRVSALIRKLQLS
ncbi:double-stranded RNA-binding protein 3 isoform X2 [Carica papaya]|nr:double-stranded RNA-binding protein 3 isoform X2 [Carica papaya]